MALESVTYVADLVVTNPTSGDPKSQGDDHLRNIKVAVKTLADHVTTDVTASRAKATNYTNNTGRIIHVVISGSNDTANGRCSFTIVTAVGTVIAINGPQAYAAGAGVNMSFSVGVGETYRIDDVTGVFTVSKWVELR